MKVKNKKGALTQTVIISIVIIIFSAAIIFFFFKALPYKELIDKEACHQSVVLRNNAFLRGENILPELIPLNCKTQEIEISSTNEEFIKREIANAMYDCWWMLGEGKMNFFESELTKQSYCVLCSTIKFSESTQEKISKINGFDEYLISTNIPNKNTTYLQYFSGDPEIAFTEENLITEDGAFIDTSTDYVIVYSVVKRDKLIESFTAPAGGLLVGVGAIGGLAAVGITVGTGGAALIAIGGMAITYVLVDRIRDLITENPDEYWIQFNLIPLEASYLRDFGCQNIESIP